MAANTEFIRVKEFSSLRGFSNLLTKESRAWWATRRWWINALLWSVLICGLLANMLFVPTVASLATEAEISSAGSVTAYVVLMGLSVFFEFGAAVVGIGAVVLLQDSIIGEKQSGVAEWLLAKPVARRAYVLAKVIGNAVPMLALMLGGPAIIGYSLLSVRQGGFFPVLPFLTALGILAVHTLFYITLTLLLGTIFSSRGPIIGIGLGSVLGGTFLGSLFKPLLYVMPWMLPKIASMVASGEILPPELGAAPLAATLAWSLFFVFAALKRFERTEF
jgi:ABC-2 type transport system permease protein